MSLNTASPELSQTAQFFCAPLPAAPAAKVLSSGAAEIALTWPNPELYSAPLKAYKLYMDDGLGGDLKLQLGT